MGDFWDGGWLLITQITQARLVGAFSYSNRCSIRLKPRQTQLGRSHESRLHRASEDLEIMDVVMKQAPFRGDIAESRDTYRGLMCFSIEHYHLSAWMIPVADVFRDPAVAFAESNHLGFGIDKKPVVMGFSWVI